VSSFLLRHNSLPAPATLSTHRIINAGADKCCKWFGKTSAKITIDPKEVNVIKIKGLIEEENYGAYLQGAGYAKSPRTYKRGGEKYSEKYESKDKYSKDSKYEDT
jgi:hypothetical protein